MSGPVTPLEPERLLSSGKISTAPIARDISFLENVWGGVFYHPDFIGPALKNLGLTGETSLIISENKEIGAMNLLFRRRPLFNSGTLPLLFQYYGPIFFNSLPDEFAAEFDNYLRRRVSFAYFSFPPNSPMPDKLSTDWNLLPSMTPVVLRKGLISWGKEFGDDVRNKLNKAGRAKVEVSKAEVFPAELWKMTFTRKGIASPIDPALLEDWCLNLLNCGLLRIYIAGIEDRAVAFRGELIFGGYAYDWLAGSDPEYHSSGANQLLMAEIGHELAQLDIEAWDLVGSEIKSIADFKKSFGAKEIRHFKAFRGFDMKGRLFQKLREFRHG